MRSLILFCIALMWMTNSQAQTQFNKNIINDKDKLYIALVLQAKDGQNIDYGQLRELYVNSSLYDPTPVNFQPLQDALKNGDYEQVKTQANKLIDQNFFRPTPHYLKARACEKTLDKTCAAREQSIGENLVRAFAATGHAPHAQPDDAYILIDPDEQQAFLYTAQITPIFHKVEKIDGHYFDQMSWRSFNGMQHGIIYFNLDRIHKARPDLVQGATKTPVEYKARSLTLAPQTEAGRAYRNALARFIKGEKISIGQLWQLYGESEYYDPTPRVGHTELDRAFYKKDYAGTRTIAEKLLADNYFNLYARGTLAKACVYLHDMKCARFNYTIQREVFDEIFKTGTPPFLAAKDAFVVYSTDEIVPVLAQAGLISDGWIRENQSGCACLRAYWHFPGNQREYYSVFNADRIYKINPAMLDDLSAVYNSESP